jgi:hypothetical protein
VQKRCLERALARPSVQPPAGVERKRALYAAYPERQGRAKGHATARAGRFCCLPVGWDRLDISAMAVFFAPACGRIDLSGANNSR